MGATSSESLPLVLEFARVEQTEDPWAFRFVPQDYLLRTPGGSFERASFAWDEPLLSDLMALARPGCDPVVPQRVGERLRRFVTPLGWPELAAQITQAVAQGIGVLLTVRSAASELYALPWELITLKASGQHVGELAGVLLRYEWPETETVPEKPLPRHGGGRVVVAWSAAGGGVPAAEHVTTVAQACRSGCHPFDYSRDVIPNASFGGLSDVLSAAKREGRPISVLHILCHGGAVRDTFGLVLDGEDPTESAGPVDAGMLRKLLAPHADMVRLVVIMACNSGNPGHVGNQLGSVAQALHRAGIAMVVASRHPLSVAGSIRLSASLYTGLLQGLQSLESALLAARSELYRETGQLDWASIQLYARAADGDDSRPVVFRPYAGLSAFGPQERRFYFGREVLTEKLWRRCQELVSVAGTTRLLAVLGPSGSGKSSVARAGLAAEIERRPLAFVNHEQKTAPPRFAMLKPGSHPLRALAAALASASTEGADTPLVVLIDQFEEIYTLCNDAAERDVFVELVLLGGQTPGLPILIVLTLRSDFIGETLRQHPALNRLFDEQSRLVTAMSDDEMRRAIAAPAASIGRSIDDATIGLLWNEAQGRDGALPLLEFALSLIWEGMLAGKTAAATLQEIGGVGGALAGKAREIYGALPDKDQATARRALARLVQLGQGTRDTRRRAAIGELCGRMEDEAAVLSVLRRFSSENARLVTLSADGRETVAEVTHEALFEHWTELRTWINESRQDRALHDRAMDAAKRWDVARRPAGLLFRSPDLDLLRSYQQRKEEDLTPLQEEFLTASVRQQRSEHLLRIGAVLSVFLAVIIASAIYIATERRRTQEERARSQAAHEKLLDTYVERGQELLFEKRDPSAGLLWLHRAQGEGSRQPALPELLKSAMQSVDAAQAVLIGHTGPVVSAAFSEDSRRVLSLSQDGTARVWEAESGRPIAVLKPDGLGIKMAAWGANGQLVLTVHRDNRVRVWQADNGRPLVELRGHDGEIDSAAWSPDGKRIVTASRDRTARVFAAEDGRFLFELKGHQGEVKGAAWSPDGKRIATVCEDRSIRVFAAEDGQLVTTLPAGKRNIFRVAFSPDGGRIATGSYDCAVQIWEAAGERLLLELKDNVEGHDQCSPEFSLANQHIVPSIGEPMARLFDSTDGRFVAELKGHSENIRSVAFSPDGRRLVTTSADHTARIWKAEDGQFVFALRGHADEVTYAAWSPNGRLIVTASKDSTARIWNSGDRWGGVRLTGHEERITSLAWSPDGRRIVTAKEDKTAWVWEVATVGLRSQLVGHKHAILSASFSPDSRRVATASSDGTAGIWEADTGRLLTALKGHGSVVWFVTFSPDGRRVITTSSDKTARIWETESGRQLFELKGHEDSVRLATFSPDGRRVATAGVDKTARLWEVDTGRLISELKGHQMWVYSAAFSHDGTRIVTASVDRTARVFATDTGRLVAVLKGHESTVNSAVFHPDGRRVVTASLDRTARVWEAESGRLLAVLKGSKGDITRATLSRAGSRILTWGGEDVARVWDTDSGRLLTELQGQSPFIDAAWSPDGRSVATTDGHAARVINLTGEQRSHEELARLIRCHVPVRFEQEGSSVIVPTTPNPVECQGTLELGH
ncbi:MAG: PD40 domain-containing protein [Myxococcales bacterium]|nr:PD40 domain-containing protein [Myxococcales bacterium]